MRKIKPTRVCTHNNMSKIVKCKRSQEEMIGFVLIIVLVSVIALVFLGISLRKKVPIQSSFEIEDFLQALMKVTSECETSTGFESIQDLIVSCLENELCNEKQSCSVLNESLTKLLDDSWPVGEDYPRSSYRLWGEYINKSFFELSRGNCTGTRTADWIAIPYAGDNVNLNLEICSRV